MLAEWVCLLHLLQGILVISCEDGGTFTLEASDGAASTEALVLLQVWAVDSSAGHVVNKELVHCVWGPLPV